MKGQAKESGKEGERVGVEGSGEEVQSERRRKRKRRKQNDLNQEHFAQKIPKAQTNGQAAADLGHPFPLLSLSPGHTYIRQNLEAQPPSKQTNIETDRLTVRHQEEETHIHNIHTRPD